MNKSFSQIGRVSLFIALLASCNEPSKITDVSGENKIVEYPCLSASSDCINILDVSTGTFQVFSSFHIDSSSDVRGAVITIHGNSRNADDYFEKMISIMGSQVSADEIMVLSPKFITSYEKTLDSDWYWNTTSWKWGMQSYTSALGASASSFQTIDSLLSKLSNKSLFPELSDIVIVGHSSGAAFVHMYSYTKSKNLFKGLNIHFAVVNNQYFVHPGSTRLQPDGSVSTFEDCNNYDNWPYGLGNLNAYMQIIGRPVAKDNFIGNKVDYFIAQNDTETEGITAGCYHDILGSNRFEKTINYMTYMDIIFPENHHQHTIIPNLGHSTNTLSSDVFRSFIDSIFN